ncbi:DUF7455 domain-containing protein [Pseudonocardia sp. GCM10023141]|uniref:DUF7455 domain-containing protein n=1 Tax=Pseudonocardia sp. GCM10023141 TaxID=3252653 RepID=UPI003612E3DB
MITTPIAMPLTAMDRCDRCGAQAKVRVVLAAGELLFCGHHTRKHSEKLAELSADMRWESRP